eukprot:1702890-Lingulodinium_polyedra.AAC.1
MSTCRCQKSNWPRLCGSLEALGECETAEAASASSIDPSSRKDQEVGRAIGCVERRHRPRP